MKSTHVDVGKEGVNGLVGLVVLVESLSLNVVSTAHLATAQAASS